MKLNRTSYPLHLYAVLIVSLFTVFSADPALSQQYNALQGVNQVKAVFDVSLGSPQRASVVFWAVKNVYDDDSVQKLPEKPEAAVVFHGPAVRLISTDRDGFSEEEKKSLDEFAAMLREMKRDGVKLEVCLYAVKVLGIDVDSILPEIDRVGNGFISVAGYQAQGYSVVTIP